MSRFFHFFMLHLAARIWSEWETNSFYLHLFVCWMKVSFKIRAIFHINAKMQHFSIIIHAICMNKMILIWFKIHGSIECIRFRRVFMQFVCVVKCDIKRMTYFILASAFSVSISISIVFINVRFDYHMDNNTVNICKNYQHPYRNALFQQNGIDFYNIDGIHL